MRPAVGDTAAEVRPDRVVDVLEAIQVEEGRDGCARIVVVEPDVDDEIVSVVLPEDEAGTAGLAVAAFRPRHIDSDGDIGECGIPPRDAVSRAVRRRARRRRDDPHRTASVDLESSGSENSAPCDAGAADISVEVGSRTGERLRNDDILPGSDPAGIDAKLPRDRHCARMSFERPDEAIGRPGGDPQSHRAIGRMRAARDRRLECGRSVHRNRHACGVVEDLKRYRSSGRKRQCATLDEDFLASFDHAQQSLPMRDGKLPAILGIGGAPKNGGVGRLRAQIDHRMDKADRHCRSQQRRSAAVQGGRAVPRSLQPALDSAPYPAFLRRPQRRGRRRDQAVRDSGRAIPAAVFGQVGNPHIAQDRIRTEPHFAHDRGMDAGIEVPCVVAQVERQWPHHGIARDGGSAGQGGSVIGGADAPEDHDVEHRNVRQIAKQRQHLPGDTRCQLAGVRPGSSNHHAIPHLCGIVGNRDGKPPDRQVLSHSRERRG